MKIMTLLIVLVLAQAQATEPYPELAGDRFPVDHWQLTLVTRDRMIDITAPGFEKSSRRSCIKEGIRRLTKDMESVPVKEWGAEPLLGFVCEYVTEKE